MPAPKSCPSLSSILCLTMVVSVVSLGCNNQEVDNLKIQLAQEKERVKAYQEDAIRFREMVKAANAERDQAKEQVDGLNDKIDDLMGIKELNALGAEIKRDSRGNLYSVSLLAKPFTNEKLAVLKNFPTLTEVYLDGPSINVDTFKILKELPRLQKLETSISATNTECLKQLSGLKNLTYLQLKRTSITDDSLAVLAKFPRLQQIRAGQTKIGDEGLKHLQNMKTLVALDLTDCNRVSDVGIAYLEKLPNLKMLKVWGKAITNKALESVGKIESLEILGMNDSNISDEGMQSINSLTKLKEVYFARTAISDFGIMQLTGATGMKKMVLRDTNITDEALMFIGKMKELEVLDMSECSSPGPTDTGIEYLLADNKIRDLNLWSTKVSDGAVEAITKMPHVVRLNLDATAITDGCMESLGTMERLTWLHIGSTKVSDKEIEKLHNLKNLRYLNLSHTEASFSDDVDTIYDKLKEVFGDVCQIVGL